MRIAIFSSSIRKGRRSHGVTLALAGKLRAASAYEVDVIDLAEDSSTPENIAGRLTLADAILFVSPEYHGAYAAALKKVTEELEKSLFIQKPIGVVSVSGGPLGGIRAALQMQQLILGLLGYPLPHMLLVPMVQDKVNTQGEFLDKAFEEKTEEFLQKFLWLAEAIQRKKEQVTA